MDSSTNKTTWAGTPAEFLTVSATILSGIIGTHGVPIEQAVIQANDAALLLLNDYDARFGKDAQKRRGAS